MQLNTVDIVGVLRSVFPNKKVFSDYELYDMSSCLRFSGKLLQTAKSQSYLSRMHPNLYDWPSVFYGALYWTM